VEGCRNWRKQDTEGTPVIGSGFFLAKSFFLYPHWDVAKNEGEFWSSLGIPPRPYFNLIVTIAMDLKQSSLEYQVTSSITNYQQTGKSDSVETWVQVGGHVFKQSGNTNIESPDAWVGLETVGGQLVQSTKTNELGRYIFTMVRPGQYKLKARVVGLPEKETTPIDIPGAAGDYDVTLP
jgi:hypothetical protein